MKKLSTFALLLLLAFVAAANASEGTHEPLFRQPYRCDYTPGPWTSEIDNGISSFGYEKWFDTDGDAEVDLVYATESFEATYGFDNRRIAFAKPVDFCGVQDPQCTNPNSVVLRTKWEFTIANGVQCKSTWVSNFGHNIVFSNCSNGKTRICNLI